MASGADKIHLQKKRKKEALQAQVVIVLEVDVVYDKKIVRYIEREIETELTKVSS